MMAFSSTGSSSSTIHVSSASENVDRTWSRTSWLRANSTERSWSTFAPLAESSSISSYVTAGRRRAWGTRRGSAVKTPSTSVYISQAPAPSAAASATAVRFEPPRPSVVTSWESAETPWNPATSTILPASSASLMRVARTSAIFALPWTVSVTIPACEPAGHVPDLLGVRDRGAAELHHHEVWPARRRVGCDLGNRLEVRRCHGLHL